MSMDGSSFSASNRHSDITVIKPMDTLNAVFDRYEQDILPNLGDRTQVDYKRHLILLRSTFGTRHPDDVKPKDIGKFLDRKKGKINANRQVAVLSSIYGYAVGSWFVAERNPCAHVKRHPTKPRDRYIRDDEFMCVYSIAPIRVQLLMDLALLTSQRQGDLLDLKWKDVSDTGIFFQQGKTGKKLLITMSKSLRLILMRCRHYSPEPCAHVVSTSFGQPYTHEGFRALWQRTMKQAMKEKILETRYTFHDLRAKAVSDSSSVEIASARAGHQNTSITKSVYDRNVRAVPPLR